MYALLFLSRVIFKLYNNNNIRWLYFGLYENILHFSWWYSPRRTGSVNIIMTRAVYSHTTRNKAIQYYIITARSSIRSCSSGFVWNQSPRFGIKTWSNDVITVPAYKAEVETLCLQTYTGTGLWPCLRERLNTMTLFNELIVRLSKLVWFWRHRCSRNQEVYLDCQARNNGYCWLTSLHWRHMTIYLVPFEDVKKKHFDRILYSNNDAGLILYKLLQQFPIHYTQVKCSKSINNLNGYIC